MCWKALATVWCFSLASFRRWARADIPAVPFSPSGSGSIKSPRGFPMCCGEMLKLTRVGVGRRCDGGATAGSRVRTGPPRRQSVRSPTQFQLQGQRRSTFSNVHIVSDKKFIFLSLHLVLEVASGGKFTIQYPRRDPLGTHSPSVRRRR